MLFLTKRDPRALAEFVVVLFLLAGSFWTFRLASQRAPFQGDESNYLYRARFFQYLFIDRDLTNPLWANGYHVHTQPMLQNYIVGAALWVGGRDPEGYKEYNWRRSPEGNASDGRVPDAATLALIRAPMIVLATGVVGLLYAVARILGGPIAGLTAGIIGLSSPLSQTALVWARNDGSLACFLLLTLLLGLLGSQRGHDGGLPLRWAVAAGLALGLALEAKLTAVFSMLGILGWGGLAGLVTWLKHGQGARARLRATWTVGSGWLLTSLIALCVFVGLNPHLWSDPLEHTIHLFEHRANEMRAQQQIYPSRAMPNVLARPALVLHGSLIEAAWSGSRGMPIEGVAATLGTLVLLARVWRSRRHGLTPGPEGLTLLTIAAYIAGISVGLDIVFGTYFLPTFLLASILSGVGASAAVRLLATAAAQRRSRPIFVD